MYLSATIIIASLSFLVEASPTSRSGFSIPLTRRSQLRDANGIVNMARLHRSVTHSIRKFGDGFHAYQKNTGATHPFAPKVKYSEKRGIGNEPLVELEWYGTISVGTPAKNFTVNIDTGSGDLFLPSSSCDSSCNGHTLYDPSASSTAHTLRTLFSLGYADGGLANGTQFTDNVTIAGYTAQSQTFGAATSYSSPLQYPGWRPDGLLGLGFPSLSRYPATPLFFNLVTEGVLPTNSFGLCPSELYIGGTNSNFYTGNFTYVPVTHQAFWQTEIDGLYLNKQPIAGATNLNAVIDTGTAMILGDNTTVQAFYGQIPGSSLIAHGNFEYYSYPCSFNATVSFQFGGVSFPIKPQTFNFGTYSSDPNACVGGIVAVKNIGFWILGDVFLKNVYMEFDAGNSRLGFATPA